MLLAVDIGNTNITIGIFEHNDLQATLRITTKQARTSDEYGILISNLLHHRQINKEEIEAVIIASVVPNIMYSFVNGMRKYINVEPLIVGPGIKTGIKIKTENPKEIGADLIVGVVAAYEMYGGPLIVVDFGTATTFAVATEDGSFIAGITSPGIKISANALWNEAAKLPEIEIKKPDTILAKDVITAMQAGLVFGHIGQVEYIIGKIKEELGTSDIKVVATGGLGKMISNETESIDIYQPDLMLEGLRIIYNKNKLNDRK